MPQFFLDSDVLFASMAELVAALFAAAVALSFRRPFPRADLLSWGWAWVSAAAFAAVSFVGNSMTWSPGQITALRAVARSAAFLQVALLLMGANGLTGRGFARVWLRRAALAAPALGLASALASALPVSTAMAILLRATSSLSVGLASLAAASWIWGWRGARLAMGARLMAVALALYGILKVFSPATLTQLGLLEGAFGGPALFVGFALAPPTFALGCVISLLEDREGLLAQERDSLRVSEEKFAKLFRSSPDAVMLTQPLNDGLIIAVNEGFERLFGYSAAEAVGKTTVELGLWADPKDRLAMIDEAMPTGRLRDREVEALNRAGQRLCVAISAERIEIGGEAHGITVIRDVTERKQAEETIRRNEELFRAVVEDQTEMIVRWKPDGTRTFVNQAYCRAFGGSVSELVGTSFMPSVGEQRREAVRRKIAALTPAAPVATDVHECVTDAGERRWQEWTDRGIFDAEGRLVELQSTGRDVTERREAERRVRVSEERLRRMSEATFEGISISENGVIVDANEQFARIHGYTLEELVGKPVSALVAPEDRQRVADAILLQLTAAYEVVGLRKDGSTFPADVRGRPLELGERRLRVVAVRDMSERSELMQRLALVGRATNDAVWDWDLKSGELWRSEGIHTLFGHAQRDVRSDLDWWSERIHPEERERVSASLQSAVDAGRQLWSDEYRFRRGDGSYADVLDRGFVLHGPDGVPVRMVGAMLDITERKRVQDALHRSRRMATVGALVAGVAHEVRTPLFGISANLDAYETHLHEPQERREFVDLLRSQVNRLSALMHDLLDYGRPRALQLARGGVDGPIQKALRSCARRAEQAGVTIAADLAAIPFELERDPSRLEQVFENLLSNAVYHSPRGSSVRVRVAAREAPKPSVVCTVEDEGPGMREEDLRKVFEPFFSRRRGGTGLGLAIVQRIVEEHGGSIRAENRAGGGALFTVLLPALAPGSGAPHALSGTPDAARRTR